MKRWKRRTKSLEEGLRFLFAFFFSNDYAFLFYDLAVFFMFNPLADIITPRLELRLELRLMPEEVMAACLFGTDIPAEMLESDSAYLPSDG